MMISRAIDGYSEKPNHKFMEQNLSMVIDQTSPLGVGVSADIQVHYQFHTVFKTHQEILYLKGHVSEITP